MIFSPDIADRLSMTLLHFLWQGGLLAILYSVLADRMKQAPARARYNLATLTLLLMSLAPIVTWFVIDVGTYNVPTINVATYTVATDDAQLDQKNENSAFAAGLQTVEGSAAGQAIGRYSIAYSQALALVWVFGVLVFSLRLFYLWFYVQRLRHLSIQAAPRDWRRRLEELAIVLGVTRPVWLLESARVDVPMVLGWLRPVIMAPAGFFTGLPPAQVEAILLHELSHVRRHDYLVNLCQSFLETLFFYHPAVWWIGERIREERELCCDDLALDQLNDPLLYSKALAAVALLKPEARIPLAVSPAASGGNLMARIDRLLYGHPVPLQRPLVPALALLIAVVSITFLPTFTSSDASPNIEPTAKTSAVASSIIGKEDHTLGPAMKLEAEEITLQELLREVSQQLNVDEIQLPDSTPEYLYAVSVQRVPAETLLTHALWLYEMSWEYEQDGQYIRVTSWNEDPLPVTTLRRITNEYITAWKKLTEAKHSSVDAARYAEMTYFEEAVHVLQEEYDFEITYPDEMKARPVNVYSNVTTLTQLLESMLHPYGYTLYINDDATLRVVLRRPGD
jgi:beta-lactamase regulating signal transducer with metallopeptidase domain